MRAALVFYGEILRATRQVGAFSRMSGAVARVVAEPLASLPSPRRVLEAGPGTGALTGAVLERLGPGDRLDLYEVNATFARFLRQGLVPREGVRVEVFERDVEALEEGARYDMIVSSLPLMNFEPEKVRRTLDLYAAHLAPGGVLGAVDYWGKELRPIVSSPSERARMREVLRMTREFLERNECEERVVFWNFPPACVRHVRRIGPGVGRSSHRGGAKDAELR
jgi:phospholipid N-methyltransferase